MMLPQFLMLLALTSAGAAVLAQEAPPGGRSMLPEGPFGGYWMGKANPLGTTQTVTVDGMPFKTAVRCIGRAGAKDPWSFQLDVRTAAPVERGDVLLASFWMRCLASSQESGSGRTAFIFQLNGPPWTDVIDQAAAAGLDWQQFFVPFESTADFPAGGALSAFRLGYDPQTLEFGGIELINYGKTKKLSELPKTRVTYRGMEAAAPWRAEAETRIRQHRMAPLSVTVIDKNGQAVPGARVDLRQTRSAFVWGTAVNEKRVTEKDPVAGGDSAKYQATLKASFNSAVLENGLKAPPLFGDWGDDWGWDKAVEAVNWLRRNDLMVRGHVLVWPAWRNLPKAWKALENDPVALKKVILEHIDNTGGGMAGTLQQWDVVNEPYANHEVTDILGESSLVDWYKAAQKADPKAKLFLNDFGILEGGGGDSGHRQHFEHTVKYLLDHGAPLQALGMQGHFMAGLTAPKDLAKILDRYAKYGLPIYVTEYDIMLKDEELAGAYTRDLLTMLYSHPAVEGVLLWGFWDGAHPGSDAALFRKDWSLKPAGIAWRDLVLGQWKTRVSKNSDSQGRVSVPAHLGDYEITATKGGRSAVGRITLKKGGAELVLDLGASTR